MLSTLRLIQLFPYTSRRSAPPLADYASFQSDNGLSSESKDYEDFNFAEANGVETECLVNDPPESANYVLVIQDEAVASRWFVMDKTRTTNYSAKQYRLSLRRDLLADFRSAWQDTPSFIQKGRIQDNRSPFLFNREGMSFNQIKTGELALPDETGCQWIVGYIARNATYNSQAAAINGPVLEYESAGTALPGAISYATEADFEKALGAAPGAVSLVLAATFAAATRIKGTFWEGNSSVYLEKNLDGSYSVREAQFTKLSRTYSTTLDDEGLAEALLSGIDILSLLAMEGITDPNPNAEQVLSLVGKTVFISATGLNYKVVFTPDESQSYLWQRNGSLEDATVKAVESAIPSSGDDFSSGGDWAAKSFLLSASIVAGTISLELIPNGEYQVSLLDPGLRPTLKDAPYDMFCIPYGDDVSIKTSQGAMKCNKELAWAAAVLLVESLASGTYDLQLLPYCPAGDIGSEGSLDVSKMDCDYAYYGNGTKSSGGEYTAFERSYAALPIIWCQSSTFSKALKSPLGAAGDYPSSALSVKERNETRKYRLVSPNLAGGFDFSPVMNGGVRAFRADCTYKPFNPYVHVAPVFGFMYGSDFGDARGLVCGGDFSLPRVTDAWETYQQQNKNYQSIFDREIETLELQQRMQRIQEPFQMVAGTVQGAASGAYAGSKLGPIGAIVGGAIGGTASLAGGIADMAVNETLRADAVDYRKDLFGYQLQNIQALPQSLAKTAAFNANNRPFPFIEEYECSDDELRAFRRKIEYNGMTVGAVGAPSDYFRAGHHDWLQCVPAGAPSEWPGVTADEWNAIASELSRGAFIYQEDEA